MVENLKRGDKVITSGGITGTVERLIDNDKVEVEIADCNNPVNNLCQRTTDCNRIVHCQFGISASRNGYTCS